MSLFFILFYLFILKNIWLLCVLVAARGLLNCSRAPPQLRHANSQLPHTCGIQFPGRGSTSGPLHWERRVLTTVPPGKSLSLFFKKYLFILAGLGLSCGTQEPCCSMQTSQLQHADSQLQHVDSQLWCACGIQCPDRGSNPGPLHWEHGVLPTGPPGKSLEINVFGYGTVYVYWPSFFVCVEVQLIDNVVLISAIQQSDPVIHVYTYSFQL